MLWIEYNGSQIGREVVKEVLVRTAKLIGVVPVAAKDWNDQIGLMAVETTRGDTEEFFTELEPLNQDDINTDPQSSKATGEQHQSQKFVKDVLIESSFETGSPGNGLDFQTGESTKPEDVPEFGSFSDDPEFMVKLRFASPHTEQPVTITFQPTITTYIVSPQKIKNQVSLNFLVIEASTAKPKVDVKGKGKAYEQDPLVSDHAHYVTDQTAITFRLEGGKLRDVESTPMKNDFTGSSENGLPPRGLVFFRPHEITGEGRQVDIWPKFEGSPEASKCWKYKVLASGNHSLQCSNNSPPVHNATFHYNNSADTARLPQALEIQVTTEFRLARTMPVTLSEMLRSGFLRPCIRHIRVQLNATFKRTETDMTFDYPLANKCGGGIELDINFDGAIGGGIPRTSFVSR
jgi:hypothetical protein